MRNPRRFSRLLFAFLLALTLRAQTSGSNDLLLIVDASGSMWGRAAGEEKIVIARRVLKDLAARLPDDATVGLIAYGHRREADCADIETLVPLGPLDRAALGATVDKLNPKGKTPITQSIEQALTIVRARPDPTTIVLLSDGIETCTGDPCAAVKKARESNSTFLLHVIGFDLSKENVASLECAAQAGGGLYFDAKNADELADALNQAVEVNQVSADSTLSIKALRNGELIDASVIVTDTETKQGAGGGRTYSSPATNPRVLPLAAGTYDVVVRAIGISGDMQQTFAGVAVAKGEQVEKVADFSTGELSVTVLRNGALSDATVSVFPSGGRTPIAGGRTYRAATSNPKIISLTAGTYDVVIKSIELAGATPQRHEGVVIKPEERVEIKLEIESGELRIGAKNGSTLVDAVVSVFAAGEPRPVAGSRTYTAATSNPRSFVLSPGKYRVVITPTRSLGGPKEIEMEVVAGKTAEQTVDFAP